MLILATWEVLVEIGEYASNFSAVAKVRTVAPTHSPRRTVSQAYSPNWEDRPRVEPWNGHMSRAGWQNGQRKTYSALVNCSTRSSPMRSKKYAIRPILQTGNDFGSSAKSASARDSTSRSPERSGKAANPSASTNY